MLHLARDCNCTLEIRILQKVAAPVEILWFVGDYYAYHARGVDAAKAMSDLAEARRVLSTKSD